MILGLDSYNNLEVPAYVLCKPNNDRIGVLNCTEKRHTIKFNDYDEISFTTYLNIDGKANSLYEKVNELMHIELPDIGRFVISDITIQSEGTKHEYKECIAVSEEVLLAQKYLELFIINKGITGSIDQVQFYNLAYPDRSLLNLVLEKLPDWTIGDVDIDLEVMQRRFEVDRQDVYSFLTDDVSKAFECIFEFDTINHKIHAHKEKNVGKDTNIHISYANLAKNVSISSSTDDIKTCLTLRGADDLTVRDINMGQDEIYNIDYFHSLEYMSQSLYDAYSAWQEKWKNYVDDYEQLSSYGVKSDELNGYVPKYQIPANEDNYKLYSHQKYYNEISYYTHEKMPDDERDITSVWKISSDTSKNATAVFVTTDGELTLNPSFEDINISQSVGELSNGTYKITSEVELKSYTSGALRLRYRLFGTTTVNNKTETGFDNYKTLKTYKANVNQTYSADITVPKTFTKNNKTYTVTGLKFEYDLYDSAKYIAIIKNPSIVKQSTTTNLIKNPNFSDLYDWSLYGLNPLKEKLAVYEAKQSIMIKANQGVYHKNPKDDSERLQNDIYNTMYLPCVNAIKQIKEEIKKVETTIANLKADQEEVAKRMKVIADEVSISNNFTDEQLKELYKFIREDELSSDNFVVTDTMTDDERLERLQELLKYGQEELAKVSIPTLSFSMDMINIYAIPEFKENSDKFYPGNYMYITLRDDYSVKVRLLTMDINYYDKNDFSVTFGNLAKLKGNKLFQDVTEALELATSAATSVSFNSSSWNKANVESTTIGQMLTDGLLAAGQRIATAKSDVVIDDRGIIISNNPNSGLEDVVIFIGGGQIAFSNDGLETVKAALGKVSYTKTVDGEKTTYEDFGLLAQFVIAGYIAGSVIEGTEITNGNGFYVDAEGNLTATKADIKGKITATSGYIGDGENGFKISSTAISNGKTSLTDEKNGVYISTKGIALGESNAFKVDSNGNLTASKATIKKGYIGNGTNGFTITDTAIYNGKKTISDANEGIYISTTGISLGKSNVFKVDNKGAITAKSGTIGGFTLASSSMYNGKSSLSDANDGVYIGTNGIALGYVEANGNVAAYTPFSVTKAGTLTAKSGTIGGATITNNSIKASNGNWAIYSNGSATFENVTITGSSSSASFGGGFSAGSSFGLSGGAKTDFNDLVANKITANYIRVNGGIDALEATIDTINANYITADDLTVGNLKTGTVNGQSVGWKEIRAITGISHNTNHALSSDGVTPIVVVTSVSYTYRNLYVLSGASGEMSSG